MNTSCQSLRTALWDLWIRFCSQIPTNCTNSIIKNSFFEETKQIHTG